MFFFKKLFGIEKPEEEMPIFEKKKCKSCNKEFILGRYEYKPKKFTNMMGKRPYWEEFGYCKEACWAWHVEQDLKKLKGGINKNGH